MGRSLEFDDLANGSKATGKAAEAVAEESTGEWLNSLYDRLQGDGYLDMFINSYLGETRPMEDIQQEQADGGSTDIDAEAVKALLLQLYDSGGKIPGLSDDPKTSEVIQLIDANPEMADNLISEYL